MTIDDAVLDAILRLTVGDPDDIYEVDPVPARDIFRIVQTGVPSASMDDVRGSLERMDETYVLRIMGAAKLNRGVAAEIAARGLEVEFDKLVGIDATKSNLPGA